jgi:hypothetical protein
MPVRLIHKIIGAIAMGYGGQTCTDLSTVRLYSNSVGDINTNANGHSTAKRDRATAELDQDVDPTKKQRL